MRSGLSSAFDRSGKVRTHSPWVGDEEGIGDLDNSSSVAAGETRHEIAQRNFVLKRVREKQKMVHQENFQEASNLVGKTQ